MAWKSYALGSLSLADALTNAASTISEHLGECVADTNAKTLTYTYGGNTYTVKAEYAYSVSSANLILFINDENGAFLLSVASSGYNNSSATYGYICAAILPVQTDKNTTELLPIQGLSGSFFEVINVTGFNQSYMNTSAYITLYQAVALGRYLSSGMSAYIGRPIVGLFATVLNNISVGQTVEVDGQTFMCVAGALFAKL